MRDALVLYLWAATCAALIAERLPEAPRGKFLRYLGSVILGLLWPVSLPMHLTDSALRRQNLEAERKSMKIIIDLGYDPEEKITFTLPIRLWKASVERSTTDADPRYADDLREYYRVVNGHLFKRGI